MTITIQDFTKARDAYRKLLNKEGKGVLKRAFKAFFDATPNVEAIVWTQSVPSFNDGDACTFSACDFQIRFADTVASAKAREEDGEDGDEYTGPEPDGFLCYGEGCEPRCGISAKQWKAAGIDPKAWKGLLEVHDDELLETVFGSNAKVTATRKGFQVDEYYCGY